MSRLASFLRASLTRALSPWIVSVYLAYCVVGSAGIYAKLQLLSKLRDVILPELRLPANYEIPILHRIAFLYPDALVGLILIPLMAVLIFGAIPKTLRLVCAATVASGLFLLIFYQVHAHWIVGQYVSFAYIVESYRFLVKQLGDGEFLLSVQRPLARGCGGHFAYFNSCGWQ
jgi:hypothetical protein